MPSPVVFRSSLIEIVTQGTESYRARDGVVSGLTQDRVQFILRRGWQRQSGGASSSFARFRAMEQVRRLLPRPERVGRSGAASYGSGRVRRREGDDLLDRGCAARGLFRGQSSWPVRGHGGVSRSPQGEAAQALETPGGTAERREGQGDR